MKAFDISQVKLKKAETRDYSAPKLKADVEGLSSDHDRIFMSFNIEHWYDVLGPTRTAKTSFLPITNPVASKLAAEHDEFITQHFSKAEIISRIQENAVLSDAASKLQRLIPEEGSFIKTSARSCKDVAMQIGLTLRYRELLKDEIALSGKEIDEMKLRSLFMEAGRRVLRFINAKDFLVACVMSERVSGDIKRAIKDNLQEPLSFVVREWMPICPPEFEFRCFVNAGKLTAITQYISTICSSFLIRSSDRIRLSIIHYFKEQIQIPLSKLYDRYAVDIALLNPEDETEWNFVVIEVNPFFELTGEGLFESEEGRKIMNGDADVEYPIMRVQETRMVDPTEKYLLAARREVEQEMGVITNLVVSSSYYSSRRHNFSEYDFRPSHWLGKIGICDDLGIWETPHFPIDEPTMNQEEDEDAFLYGDTTQLPTSKPSISSAPVDQEMEPVSEEGEVDDEEEEEESDSDIEFVIETEPGKRAAPPPSAQPFALRLTSQSRPLAAPEKSISTANQIKAETSVAAPAQPVEGVEIDKVAEYNGQPLLNLDLESLEDKPWRKPGADATDYFNYGFDEFTWTAYCSKQTNLRKEFNPAAVMGIMTGMPPDMQAMMSQFPMPPEMMFGGMGMMPDPNAFGQQGFGGGGGGFGQPPPGPSGQPNFGGQFGGFPPPQQQQQPQQQQGYGQPQYGIQQQQQLQPPKFPGQRMGSPVRMESPNTTMNIPSGPQAMSGQQGYWGNVSGSMRGAPRGAPRRGY